MAKIRHIALATQDPERTAKFYQQALGLKKVEKIESPLADGYYLTDGYINLAILKFKTDDVATTEGAPKYAGLHHFGFKVDDMGEACKRMEHAGAKRREAAWMATIEQSQQGKVEVKFVGPDGVTIDLSESGWIILTG